jgi:hypothetical protein
MSSGIETTNNINSAEINQELLKQRLLEASQGEDGVNSAYDKIKKDIETQYLAQIPNTDQITKPIDEEENNELQKNEKTLETLTPVFKKELDIFESSLKLPYNDKADGYGNQAGVNNRDEKVGIFSAAVKNKMNTTGTNVSERKESIFT